MFGQILAFFVDSGAAAQPALRTCWAEPGFACDLVGNRQHLRSRLGQARRMSRPCDCMTALANPTWWFAAHDWALAGAEWEPPLPSAGVWWE